MRAVIFDMDGTLTKPCLDFDAIRAEMGLSGEPILEAMARMTPDERARIWLSGFAGPEKYAPTVEQLATLIRAAEQEAEARGAEREREAIDQLIEQGFQGRAATIILSAIRARGKQTETV